MMGAQADQGSGDSGRSGSSRASRTTTFWSRSSNFIYCVLFLVVEGGYIALAGFLLNHALPLPNPSLFSFLGRHEPSTDAIKSAIGTAFIVWHTLSGFFAGGVISDAFSREWTIPRRKRTTKSSSPSNPPSASNGPSPPKVHHTLDRVSTLTSGLLDKLRHLSDGSLIFQFAFIASCILFSLVKSGPPTIIFDNAIDAHQIQTGGILLGTSDLSHSILKVEILLNSTLGYATEGNWIIPKPAQDASLTGGSVQYASDVISFQHSCDWYTPAFTPETVEFGDQIFDFRHWDTPTTPNETIFGSGVFPVRALNPIGSTSAFLVFGGNSSFPLSADPLFPENNTKLAVIGQRAIGNTIDLGQLPALHNASRFNFTSGRFQTSDGNSLVFRAPLATGLLCDAHAELSTHQVNLTSNRLAVQPQSISSHVGNINETDLPEYFSYALDGVGDEQEFVMTLAPGLDPNSPQLSELETPLIVDFTLLAAYLLLPQIPIQDWMNASLTPLSLSDISVNMDRFMSSVSKAQNIDGGTGFQQADLLIGNSSSPHELPAKERSPNQILKTSQHWFWLTVALTAATFVSCLCISTLIEMEPREYVHFTLANVWERTFDHLPLCESCKNVPDCDDWKMNFPRRKVQVSAS